VETGPADQSSSPSSEELLLEFELLFELELLLEFELELELEFELLFELELLLLFELEFELELLLLFELLFEFDPLSSSFWKIFFRKRSKPSSATAGAAAKVVAMNATVAALVMVFIGGFLLCKKQPSVTAQGKRVTGRSIPRASKISAKG
jgi:hypothetical protein